MTVAVAKVYIDVWRLKRLKTAKLYVEFDDECVTASEMYSCGREKEPGLVDIMFNSGKGNATVVRIRNRLLNVFLKFKKT
jgi:hypothetical protein